MSNTYKAIIVAIAVLISISGIYILSKSNSIQNTSNVAVLSSSQIKSISVSSKETLSSSSLSVQTVSKVVEAPVVSKVTILNSQIIETPKPSCVNPDPINIQLINKNNLCFGLINWDNETLSNFQEKFEVLNLNEPMTIDYYKKIQNSYISKFNQVNIRYYKIINQNQIESTLSMQDSELLLKKYPKLTEIAGPLNLNQAKYNITKDPTTNIWSFKFIQFEN